MSLHFLITMAIYLILYILSWVPLDPKCIQVSVLLVYSIMEKQPRFSSVLVYLCQEDLHLAKTTAADTPVCESFG